MAAKPKPLPKKGKVLKTQEWFPKLKELVGILFEQKADQVAREILITATKNEITTTLREHGLKDFRDPETGHKVTLVEGTSTFVDEEKLKQRIGVQAFNKLTTPQLDMRKVEAAVTMGTLDEADLAECTEEKPIKPYLRTSGG